MYITNNNVRYPCEGYDANADTARFIGVVKLAIPIIGEITLCRDDDFELATQSCGDYARQTYENGVLTLTNEPEPIPQPTPEQTPPQPTLEERTTALEATQADVIDVLASALGATI